MTVLDVKKVGDMTVTDYALGQQATDRTRLLQAIGLSLKCPPSDKAYSVGAVLVTRDGQVFTGYSRETAPDNHAEEEAILKAEQAGATLEGATIYSSMEPCSTRRSKPRSCSALIIDRRMKRVVFAVREPDRFVRCRGEQPPKAVILPPAGRAEQDTTVMQSADLIKNFALNELFPILQQGAVQIAANHFYHICFPLIAFPEAT